MTLTLPPERNYTHKLGHAIKPNLRQTYLGKLIVAKEQNTGNVDHGGCLAPYW